MNRVPIDENKWLRSWVFVAACVITGLITQMVALPAFAVDASKPESVIRVSRLIDQAIQQGTVRVIVGLNIPFTPEGQLATPQTLENQHQTIATTQEVVWQKLALFHARFIAKFKYIPFMTLRVDAEALKQLAQLAEVRSITEDVPVPLIMESSNGVIGSNEAWAMGYTGAGQTVAILDSGVDKTHPFFSTANKVVSEACYSTNDASYTSISVCPDGAPESTAPDSGIDCTAVANDLGLADAVVHCAHGTHVAGSAAGNDGIGPNFGVAKDAEVIAVQIFSIFSDPSICGTSGGCALSWQTDQIKGLERVFELHSTFDIAAVNMSLGGGQNFTFCDTDVRKAAIDNLRSVGIATVIGSGNNGFIDSMGAPACISTAVSVGATEDNDDIASFSNIAPFISLLAPGVDIISSVPGDGTASREGTSMASAHVAGAWALLKSAEPTATVDEILNTLQSTGTLLNDNRFGGTVTNMPRINVDLAAEVLVPSLSITKTANPSPVEAGSLLDYTLEVHNNSLGTLTGVTITDNVPADTTYVPGSADCGGSESAGIVSFPLGTMNSGDMASCTFQVEVDAGVSTTVLFSDDFESGFGHWTMTGLWNDENEADTCGSMVAPFPSSSHAAYFGDDTSCTYDTGAPESGGLSMVTPVLLSGYAPKLTFSSYKVTECNGICEWENHYVEISNNSGTTWTILGEIGSEGAWYQASFDLSPYIGDNVLIRFRFDSVDEQSNDYFGWMVDNVEIVDDAVIFNEACVLANQGDSDCARVTTPVLLAQNIVVSPDSLASTQLPNTQTTQVLDISNIGNGVLDWIIEEAGPTRLLQLPVKASRPVVTEGVRGESTNANAFLGNSNANAMSSATEANSNASAMTHSLDQSVMASNSMACWNTITHFDNSYLRVFDLNAFGITSDFNVIEVEIGLEKAENGAGTQPATVNLYTLDGSLIFSNLTLIGSANINIPEQKLTHLTIPVTGTVPAGSQLVVEIFTPNGQADGNLFFIGSNNLGQTAPSYIAAAHCDVSEPMDIADLGFPDMHIVMNVRGSEGCSSPEEIPWLSTSPSSGTTAPGDSSSVDVVFDSTGLDAGIYKATLCVNSNDPDTPVVEVPVSLEVSHVSNDLVIDFGPSVGIWAWLNNNTWQSVHSISPDSMVTGNLDGNSLDDVVIDFGAQYGIWKWMNNSTWEFLHSISPEDMVTGDLEGNGQDDVIIDLGAQYGIWVRMNNSTWVQLHSLSPEGMVTGDIDGSGQDEVIIDFGAQDGIWVRMNNSSWVKLHSLSPEGMVTGDIDGNGQDDVIIDFGVQYGISVRMNNSSWVKLHSLSPDSMVTGDLDGNGQDDVIIDFGDSFGIWVFMNNGAWVKLHNLSADSMVTGNLDGVSSLSVTALRLPTELQQAPASVLPPFVPQNLPLLGADIEP